MTDHILQEFERREITGVVDSLLQGRNAIVLAEALDAIPLLAQEFPRSVRKLFNDLRRLEAIDILLLRTGLLYPCDQPTPSSITEKRHELASANDVVHLAFAALLGDVFTFRSIQHGNLINDVLPIAENAALPMSSGSSHPFKLHTEDAFSPCCGEYLGLLCLRNPNRTPTILSRIRDVTLSEQETSLLSDPQFRVRPNLAHAVDASALPTQPILFGHPDTPYFRINTNADDNVSPSPAHRTAYASFADKLSRAAFPVVLSPGDYLYLDNFTVAHGRPPFAPRFNGDDRWLRRLYITTDLRKSRSQRVSVHSRVIETR